MYKKSRAFFLLFLCFLMTNFIITPSMYHLSVDQMPHCSLNKLPEEGFCAGTLIKTPYGYELIENLVMGDTVIDAYGNSTEIVAIISRCVNEYIKVFLKNITLCVGRDQQFYCFSSFSWIKAREVFCDKERIIDPTILYALTTHSHTLSVTPQNLCAHNAAAIFCGVSSICCGYVTIINPVVAILGGVTVSLAVIAHNAYQMYVEKHKNEDGSCLVDIPDSVVLAERFYYEQRKEALEKLRQELIGIKKGLQIIKGLSSSGFTYQLLPHYTYEVKNKIQFISIAQEKKLSDVQKKTLRDLRESDLALLEKQLCDIQFLLALHINQLIENIEHAQRSYDGAIGEIQKAIAIWNSNLEKMTLEAAFKLYKYDLLREHLVYVMRQAFNELLLVAEYYRACMSQCIQSSTTIISTLDHILPIIDERKSWILQEEKLARNNSAVIERYFAAHNVSVDAFKKEAQKEFDKEQKQRDTEVQKRIEMQQQVNSDFGGGPKKDKKDDDEKDEHPHGIYKDAKYHHRNSNGRKSPCPNDGQKCLDKSLPKTGVIDARVSMEDGKFVVLRKTAYREYHGYCVTWNELPTELQQLLVDAGVARITGKIIREMAYKVFK